MNWISIEDGEPEKHSHVLVTTCKAKVLVAEYRGNDWWVTVPGGWNLYVISWAPLPEPSKDKRCNNATT